MTRQRPRSLTEDEVVRARSHRANGKSYSEIGAMFGVSYNSVRRRLDVDYRDRNNAQARVHGRSRYFGSTGVTVGVARGRQVPDDVLAERERASRAEISLTAALLGDPLPGRSALDKLRTIKPSSSAETPMVNISAQVALSNKPWSLR